MTLHEFRLLSDREKFDILYTEGAYIGKRKAGHSRILLYQLNAFYVEIYYEKYRCLVNRVHCFRSTALLDPYLPQIDIEQIVHL